jgi:hypothetical protein
MEQRDFQRIQLAKFSKGEGQQNTDCFAHFSENKVIQFRELERERLEKFRQQGNNFDVLDRVKRPVDAEDAENQPNFLERIQVGTSELELGQKPHNGRICNRFPSKSCRLSSVELRKAGADHSIVPQRLEIANGPQEEFHALASVDRKSAK